MAVRARSAEQARLIRFFNSTDDFYPYRDWPFEIQRLVLNPDRGYQDRWFLTAFWFWNGLRPEKVQEWSALGQVRWTPAKERHVSNLIRDMSRGATWPRRVWDMGEKAYAYPPQRR